MDKPFLSVIQMIDLLEKRGVKTDEQTAGILRCENYYSVINGYKELFFVNDIAIEGTAFSEIYAVFQFDRDLRQYLLPWLMQVESMMKTVVAHKASEYYATDLEFYRDSENYDQRVATFQRTVDIMEKRRNSDRPSLNHYRKKYGCVPLWVLVVYLTFGELSHFYSTLGSQSIKNAIAKEISEICSWAERKRLDVKRLELYLWVLSDFRNICAHDERLYCQTISRARISTGGTNVGDLYGIIEKLLPKELKHVFVSGWKAKLGWLKDNMLIKPETKKVFLSRMGIEMV